MKVEGLIFASLAAFFVARGGRLRLAVPRGGRHHRSHPQRALALAIGFYTCCCPRASTRARRTARRRDQRGGRGVRLLQPAQLVAAAPAASAAIMMLGFAFGWWLTVLGAVLPRQLRDRVRVRVLPRVPRRGLTDQGSARAPRRRGPPHRTRRRLLRRRGPAVPEQPVRLRGADQRDARRRQHRGAPGRGRPGARIRRAAHRGGRSARARRRDVPGVLSKDGSTWTVSGETVLAAGDRLRRRDARGRRRRPRPDRQGHLQHAHGRPRS